RVFAQSQQDALYQAAQRVAGFDASDIYHTLYVGVADGVFKQRFIGKLAHCSLSTFVPANSAGSVTKVPLSVCRCTWAGSFKRQLECALQRTCFTQSHQRMTRQNPSRCLLSLAWSITWVNHRNAAAASFSHPENRR